VGGCGCACNSGARWQGAKNEGHCTGEGNGKRGVTAARLKPTRQTRSSLLRHAENGSGDICCVTPPTWQRFFESKLADEGFKCVGLCVYIKP